MDYENKIEIPFGAKDSELCECEYTIPQGYEAEIKDGKVIIRKKESDDEKIRKDIIHHIEFGKSHNIIPCKRAESWIAYLEKQDEQKPQGKSALEAAKEEKVDNQNYVKPTRVEPKFKVGDWVMLDRPVLITKVEDMPYNTHQYWTSDGTWFGDATKAKLWTIQDAKDGDVLCCESGWTCIFKTLVNDETFSSYCFMDDTKWFCETGSECHTLKDEFVKAYNGKIYPATKEQRDLLFQKMHEAGYEWDADKKELKKIEKKLANIDFSDLRIWKYIVDAVLTEREGIGQYLDSPWTTEVAKKLQKRFGDIEQNPVESNEVFNDFVRWFVGERTKNYTLIPSDEDIQKWSNMILEHARNVLNNKQKPVEWNEDDEEIYKKIETAIDSYYAPFSRDTEEMQEWFKNLKNRVQSQQRWIEEEKHKLMKKCVDKAYQSGYDTGCKLTKQEMEHNSQWSEEDEKYSSYICAALDCYYRLREDRNNTNGQEDLDKARNWLYNRLNTLRPQNTWKPSDEQMVALKCAITTADEKWVCLNTKDLESLYEDLKKLKGCL